MASILEVCFCCGGIAGSITSQLATMNQPVPIITYFVMSMIGISVVCTFAYDY